MPIRAAPVAPPTMAVSDSGMSITRQGPNSSWKPSVTLNAPPYTPTSSPSTNTRGSRRISWRNPSEIACRYVFSGIARRPSPVVRRVELVRRGEHAVEQGGRVRQRRGLGALHRLVDQPLHPGGELALALVREHAVLVQPAAEALDRVPPRPLLEHLAR